MKYAAPLFLALVLVPTFAFADAFQDADAAMKRHDKKAAVEILQPLAEKGDARAQDMLGGIYNVDAVAQAVIPEARKLENQADDNAEAFKWESKAAAQGYAPAEFQLGALYWRGAGVKQDNAAALDWYLKAANQGDVGAQCAAADIYAHGWEDAKQDKVKAYMWYSLAVAADKTDAPTAKSRDDLAATMTPEQIAEGKRLAAEWKPAPSQKP